MINWKTARFADAAVLSPMAKRFLRSLKEEEAANKQVVIDQAEASDPVAFDGIRSS